MLPDSSHDGAANPRPSRFRFPSFRHPLVLHGLGLLAAAALTWLVWRGYRQPGFLLDLANGMMLC